jgi:phosphoribosylglycinamide formyltransferase-1
MQPSALSPQLFSVVVFASGRGSNFAALLLAQTRGEIPIRIRALLSDKTKAAALDIARKASIPAIALSPRDYPDRASFDRAMFSRAAEFQPDLIALTGYMRVIDATVIEHWRGRVVNIHPSLLPKYPGLQTHQRALEAGDTRHGASVHFVTAELDGGPVIAQIDLPIAVDDTAETLAARLLQQEHRLLIATVDLIARGHVALGADGVTFDGRAQSTPLRFNESGTLTTA